MTRLISFSSILIPFFWSYAICLSIGDDFLGTWYGVFQERDEGNLYDVVLTIVSYDGKQMNGMFAFTDKTAKTTVGELKGVWVMSQSDARGWGLSFSGR